MCGSVVENWLAWANLGLILSTTKQNDKEQAKQAGQWWWRRRWRRWRQGEQNRGDVVFGFLRNVEQENFMMFYTDMEGPHSDGTSQQMGVRWLMWKQEQARGEVFSVSGVIVIKHTHLESKTLYSRVPYHAFFLSQLIENFMVEVFSFFFPFPHCFLPVSLSPFLFS